MSTTNRRKEIILNGKGKLYLTKELQDEIAYLHQKVGSIEWSGALFFKKVAGEISDPSSIELRAEKIYLMDIGSAAYTSAEFDSDSVMDMWDVVDNDYTYKQGLIHTHHSMTTFFSGTDMAELHESAPLHNYYLSLIVNFAGAYTARVAWVGERTVSVKFKDSNDTPVDSSTSEEILFQIELEIVKEKEDLAIGDTFRTRYESIAEEKKKSSTRYSGYSGYPGYTGGYNSGTSTPAWKRAEDDWNDGEYSSAGGDNSVGSYVSQSGKYAGNADGSVTDKETGKVLKPFEQLKEKLKKGITEWLCEACSIYDDMKVPLKMPDTIEAYVEFFDEYFQSEDINTENKFFDIIQTRLVNFVGDFSANFVAREALDFFKDLKDPLSYKFEEVLEAYPQYMATVKEKAVRINGKK